MTIGTNRAEVKIEEILSFPISTSSPIFLVDPRWPRPENRKIFHMDLYLPGDISDIGSALPGSCIIFATQQEMHVGILVAIDDEDIRILDLEADDGEGGKKFLIRSQPVSSSGPVVNLEKSRIVPDITPSSLGLGYFNQGRRARAIYLTELGPVVIAEFRNDAHIINLRKGIIYQGNLGSQYHSKQWRIETDDGAGRFQTLRDFIA